MPTRSVDALSEPALVSGCGVLLLEDDTPFRKRLAGYLRREGAEVTEAASLAEARAAIAALRFEYAVVDFNLPDGRVLDLLRDGAFSENTGIVVMTAFGGLKQAVEAMRLGADDYLTKPFELEELDLALAHCRTQRRVARQAEYRAERTDGAGSLFFGHALRNVRQQLEVILAADQRLARRLPPILIEGETGTGKSVLARWLHRQGPRAARPFIVLNCAALPETLAEGELFGHERGAYTDAKHARIGLFEAADGGTIFLDEIGALALPTQAKLLTAVEDGTIRRLGGTREIAIDARIVTASNRPLGMLVKAGQFRDDLYHRLDLLRVTLPPLRERGSDLIPLARHLLEAIAHRHRLPGLSISAAGEARLQAQSWPGNIRELAHEIERAVLFSSNPQLDFAALAGGPAASPYAWRNPGWRLPAAGFSLEQAVDALIAEALQETGQNVSAAARRLGVTRDYLRYRLPRAARSR